MNKKQQAVWDFFSRKDIFADAFNFNMRQQHGHEIDHKDLTDLDDVHLTQGDEDSVEIIKLWQPYLEGKRWNMILRLVVSSKSAAAYGKPPFPNVCLYQGEMVPVLCTVLCLGV